MLPFNTAKYARQREFVTRLKGLKLRVAIYVVATAAVGCGIALGLFSPIFLLAGLAVMSVHLMVRQDRSRQDRVRPGRRSKPRRRAAR